MDRTIEWRDGVVATIDQTKLPTRSVTIRLNNVVGVAKAISTMKMRGAPLIGVASAYGLALTAFHSKARTRKQLMKELEASGRLLVSTRPTAVNLRWAVDRIISKAKLIDDRDSLALFVVKEARTIAEEDYQANLAIGHYGATLIKNGDTVLTHCNAGALATAGYGTALGVIRAAVQAGKKITVIASETRPLLQGARLTAYELLKSRIPVTVITDNAVGHVMQMGIIDKIVVGADRILSTGHVFNKIGTYGLSILAKAHGVPLYVAAPTSTIDMVSTLKSVKIEERAASEVQYICGVRVVPRGVKILNPAFDITPPENVEAIVTENGLAFRPYTESLQTLVSSKSVA